jgi:hypothetical protein
MSWRETYKSTLKQLSSPSLYGEILRLENSIKNLRRSNDELRLYESNAQEDTSWIPPIIVENDQVIAKQSEQVDLVKVELSDRGALSDHSNDLTNGDVREVGDDDDEQDAEQMEIDESIDGVHL